MKGSERENYNFTLLGDAIFDELRAITDDRRLLTDDDILETYAHDETKGFLAMPEAVVRVNNTEEISRICDCLGCRIFIGSARPGT